MAARLAVTLDSNVLVAALKADEASHGRCAEVVRRVAEAFLLSEPSIIYQEVCGTLARRVGADVADAAKEALDNMIDPRLLVSCDRAFCTSAYRLCGEYGVYAIDALYLKVALDSSAILVSLDKEDFVDRLKKRAEPAVEAYHVSDFPY